MRKCLVTGATGLIGSNLLPALERDWEILGISRCQLKGGLDSGKVQHLAVDLSQAWDTEALPPEINAVIHLAQSEHFREFPEYAVDVFQVNTMSTLRLLDYARRAGASTFVLASSGGIYGHGNQEFSEDAELPRKGDLGFYLGTKLCAEVLAESYTPLMNVMVLRFFFVYGPGQRKNMLIPRLVQAVLDGRPITLQGQSGIRINPTYVSDAVAAICRCLELEGGHKINVGGPEVLSLREIGEIIGKATGRNPEFDIQHGVEPRHLVGDVRKMTGILGAPMVRFEEGIRNYISSLR